MRHIQFSQSAAKSIASAMKLFMAKKEYYALQMKINPNIITKSKFLRIILNQKKARSCNHSHHKTFFNTVQDHAQLLQENNSENDSYDISLVESPEMLEQSLSSIEHMNNVYEQLLDELEQFQRDKDYFYIIGDFKE